MIVLDLFEKIKIKNALWKEREISSLLTSGEKVLDYGCGDLMFAKSLKKKVKGLRITGVDVVDAPKIKDITFIKYNGGKLPFKNGSFDTVVSIYVFHHCNDAEVAFKECVRVAKKRVIFIEAIARGDMEILPMKFMDWFFNVWKPEPIPLTFKFRTLKQWQNTFKKLKLKVGVRKAINNPLAVLPIGKGYLFEVKK